MGARHSLLAFQAAAHNSRLKSTQSHPEEQTNLRCSGSLLYVVSLHLLHARGWRRRQRQQPWLPLPGVGPGGSEQAEHPRVEARIPQQLPRILPAKMRCHHIWCTSPMRASGSSKAIKQARSPWEHQSGSWVYKRPFKRNLLWTESLSGEGAVVFASRLQR